MAAPPVAEFVGAQPEPDVGAARLQAVLLQRLQQQRRLAEARPGDQRDHASAEALRERREQAFAQHPAFRLRLGGLKAKGRRGILGQRAPQLAAGGTEF